MFLYTGLAPRCLEVLEQIILASYDEISLRDRHKVVLYQVRLFRIPAGSEGRLRAHFDFDGR